jgi:hypothetical protein
MELGAGTHPCGFPREPEAVAVSRLWSVVPTSGKGKTAGLLAELETCAHLEAQKEPRTALPQSHVCSYPGNLWILTRGLGLGRFSSIGLQ